MQLLEVRRRAARHRAELADAPAIKILSLEDGVRCHPMKGVKFGEIFKLMVGRDELVGSRNPNTAVGRHVKVSLVRDPRIP